MRGRCARHDLTRSQRKQFAAEVGRLLDKMRAVGHLDNVQESWLVEMSKHLSIDRRTLLRWWDSFCEEASPDITPLRALDIHKAQFYDWLEEQQHKQFAAEIGRVIQKIAKNPTSQILDLSWWEEIWKRSGVTEQTLRNWWNAFCQDSALALTPRQALDIHKAQFYDWLEAQQRQAEAEKQRKQFAAEVRWLLAKLEENSQLANGQKNWLAEMANS